MRRASGLYCLAPLLHPRQSKGMGCFPAPGRREPLGLRLAAPYLPAQVRTSRRGVASRNGHDRTGHPPARPGRISARPAGVGGANTKDCARAPDQNTLRWRHQPWPRWPMDARHQAVRYTAWARGLARRARGARHNGGCVQRGYEQSFSGSFVAPLHATARYVELASGQLTPPPCQDGAGLDARTGLLFQPCAERAMLW